MKMFLIFMNIFATFFASHPAPNLSPSALGSVSKVHPDRTAFPYFGPRHLLTGIVYLSHLVSYLHLNRVSGLLAKSVLPEAARWRT